MKFAGYELWHFPCSRVETRMGLHCNDSDLIISHEIDSFSQLEFKSNSIRLKGRFQYGTEAETQH